MKARSLDDRLGQNFNKVKDFSIEMKLRKCLKLVIYGVKALYSGGGETLDDKGWDSGTKTR